MTGTIFPGATLRGMGIETCFRWSFGDHHQYRPAELARLRIGMEIEGEEELLGMIDGAVRRPQ